MGPPVTVCTPPWPHGDECLVQIASDSVALPPGNSTSTKIDASQEEGLCLVGPETVLQRSEELNKYLQGR